MPRAIPTLLVLLPLVLAARARADVLLTTLDSSEPLRGISLTIVGDEATIHSAEGPVRKVPLGGVIEIVTVPAPPAAAPRSLTFEVELTCGSRLRGIFGKADAPESMRLDSTVLELDPLPFESVYAVRRADGAAMPGASRLVRIPDTDAAFTLTGAKVEGTVASLSATEISLRRGERDARTIPLTELAALFLDTHPVERPDDLHAVVRLVDGSAVLLRRGFRIQGGVLSGRTPSGVAIRVGSDRISAIGFQGERFIHLSDLKPTRVERTPFFPLPEGPTAAAMLDFVCPLRMDRSPDGNPITLAQHRFFKGIGVRPHTEITYDLGGGFATFEATCGIDDEVLGPAYGHGGGTGSVVFLVKVDGKKVFASDPVEGGRPPVPVHVDVQGAKTLTLVVALVPKEKMPKDREDSPALDNAVWARPILVK